MQDERTIVVHSQAELIGLPTRRSFLKALGVGGTLVLMPSVFAACNDNTVTGTSTTAAQSISLGTDAGIFTFAYVLEQLEASFYQQVVQNFSTLFNSAEQEMLADIRNDEVLHREFLRAVVGSSFPNLTFNFGSLGTGAALTNAVLLNTALTLETNGIAAYNGAGYALKNAKNLLVAGKIVSIEARHTSAIADSIDLRSASPTGTLYADLTQALPASLGASDANALDAAAPAATVAANAQGFIVNPITLTA